MDRKPFYGIAFVGGGCDGEYLARCGNKVTRDPAQAKFFRSPLDATVTDYQLLSLNRPRRSVTVVHLHD